MKSVKVNITLEGTVWQEFCDTIPPRKKSRVINALIKKELGRISRERQDKELALAFREAADDRDRARAIEEWEVTDTEGWE